MKEDGGLAEEMGVERVSPGQQPLTDRILTRRDAIETDKTNPICKCWGSSRRARLNLTLNRNITHWLVLRTKLWLM